MATAHRVNRLRLSHDFSAHIVSLRPLFGNRRRLEMLCGGEAVIALWFSLKGLTFPFQIRYDPCAVSLPRV